jgi:hypothetical protein
MTTLLSKTARVTRLPPLAAHLAADGPGERHDFLDGFGTIGSVFDSIGEQLYISVNAGLASLPKEVGKIGADITVAALLGFLIGKVGQLLI